MTKFVVRQTKTKKLEKSGNSQAKVTHREPMESIGVVYWCCLLVLLTESNFGKSLLTKLTIFHRGLYVFLLPSESSIYFFLLICLRTYFDG